jgi:hypothetical protein
MALFVQSPPGERDGVRAGVLLTSACTLDLLAFLMISTRHNRVQTSLRLGH